MYYLSIINLIASLDSYIHNGSSIDAHKSYPQSHIAILLVRAFTESSLPVSVTETQKAKTTISIR